MRLFRRSLDSATFVRRALVFSLLFSLSSALAQNLIDARVALLTGEYQECIEECEKADPPGYQVEAWRLVHARALLAVGSYPEAENVISNALETADTSLLLRELGVETARRAGNPELAQKRLVEINDLAASRIYAYRDPQNVVALGRVALMLGADPRTVLERLYMPSRQADPEFRDAWLASGQLALDKHDYARAAQTLNEAREKFPADADILFGLAQAYQPSSRSRMLELLEEALSKNENHVPSMLLIADHLIDAEEYDEADKMLERAFKVNPWHPKAWGYRAVLAHLRNDPVAETEARAKALKFWETNPEVDHLIGMKLSQKYRFAEGAACQQRALQFDPTHLDARIQLAEDLLRLGEEEAGWALAESVHEQDGYDVTAYNLVTLQGTMEKFATLTNEHFVLRMGADEAALYGDRALALLDRARADLVEKYGVTLEDPTYVEIFPEQKDFEVRTFGMPGNPGFLGVCFGRVVTANSPASQGGSPANWEAVLWHEFCHVVTLQLTKNKMPRWLSEGISVYEELQKNPSWGQRMNPQYREMILGEDLTPVSELSSAFLSPKSQMHVQFAYYQSALVVEHLVDRFGFESLKAILRDLGEGVGINDAIARHTAPMKDLEKEFAAFARAKARALGPELEWDKPAGASPILRSLGLPEIRIGRDDVEDTKNYWVLLQHSAELVRDKQWTDAKVPLKKLIELYPDQSGPNNAYALLAMAHRGLNETEQERAVLEQWAERDSDALEAYHRLMELAEQDRDWDVVFRNAERFLAVNPLVPQPYRFLAQASEELNRSQAAITAYQKLLLLDPIDPAGVHFRLGRLLHLNNDPSAKRQVLLALEEAPRFREAHRLLLEITQTESNSTNAPVPQELRLF